MGIISIVRWNLRPVRFSVSPGDKRAVSSKGSFGECALVPVFVPGEHPNVPSFRFSFRGNIRTYPRSGFRPGGTSERTLVPVFIPGEDPKVPSFRFLFRRNIRQNHPFGNHPFVNPRGNGFAEGFLADVPPERKPERGYVRMFPRNEIRNEGTFAKTTL